MAASDNIKCYLALIEIRKQAIFLEKHLEKVHTKDDYIKGRLSLVEKAVGKIAESSLNCMYEFEDYFLG